MRWFSTMCIAIWAVGRPMVAALPEPPLQRTPWIRPSIQEIPDYVMVVAEAMFDAGLADPRGGEYRVIKIRVGNIHSFKTAVIETHGWAFPDSAVAVCWSGLVYETVEVGERADLAVDVAAGRRQSWIQAQPEEYAVHPANGRPIGVGLLLRLGELKLAEQLWLTTTKPPPLPAHPIAESEWLSAFTDAWLGAAFERAITAHMRGDDRLAVDVSESV